MNARTPMTWKEGVAALFFGFLLAGAVLLLPSREIGGVLNFVGTGPALLNGACMAYFFLLWRDAYVEGHPSRLLAAVFGSTVVLFALLLLWVLGGNGNEFFIWGALRGLLWEQDRWLMYILEAVLLATIVFVAFRTPTQLLGIAALMLATPLAVGLYEAHVDRAEEQFVLAGTTREYIGTSDNVTGVKFGMTECDALRTRWQSECYSVLAEATSDARPCTGDPTCLYFVATKKRDPLECLVPGLTDLAQRDAAFQCMFSTAYQIISETCSAGSEPYEKCYAEQHAIIVRPICTKVPAELRESCLTFGGPNVSP